MCMQGVFISCKNSVTWHLYSFCFTYLVLALYHLVIPSGKHRCQNSERILFVFANESSCKPLEKATATCAAGLNLSLPQQIGTRILNKVKLLEQIK